MLIQTNDNSVSLDKNGEELSREVLSALTAESMEIIILIFGFEIQSELKATLKNLNVRILFQRLRSRER